MRKSIPLVMLLIVSSSCGLLKNKDSVSESRDLIGFRAINAGYNVSLVISVGTNDSVAVDGPDELLKEITTSVDEGVLIVRNSSKIGDNDKVRVRVGISELRSIELWGASDAQVVGLKGEEVRLRSGGSSTIEVDGRVRKLDLLATGSSKINAERLTGEVVLAKAHGASSVTVKVSDSIDAEALGASSVKYGGNPKDVRKSASGVSTIETK